MLAVYTGFYLLLGLFPFGYCSNSQNICQRDPADTTASKTPGDNGFRIKIHGRPQPETYTPGQVYTVTINGTYPDQKLLGFMLVAVPRFAQDETTAMGTFQHFNHGLTKFADECGHVVMHTYEHAKAGVEVLWTAPPEGTGCVEFRATVIEYKDIWYKDDGALTKVFCENTGIGEATPPELMPDCCACGTGKYQMTFHGLWSRHRHPKDYPTMRRLLHWSNIVGASHNKNYNIWQYGAYASKGVQEVCEFGYPRTLEQEMRQHSHGVRTVIKTPGIWWSDPVGLQQTRWARFSVDKRNHLLSMLSMVGPSPDWCVGVSALNLCLPNCTWAGDMSIELFPWDAGTDDGVTYMSRNMKSDPPQKIHRITNTFPNNPASPFFGPEPIRPLAVLTLRRIHPKPGTSPSCHGNETEAPDAHQGFDSNGEVDISDMEMKKKLMMNITGGKCALSEWGDWSECSVTCGVGQRFRKRMYFNPMVDENMCGSPLMENENCIGIENECESLDDDCAMTGWSDWSPCSITCGKGIRERKRYYLRKMDMKKCNRESDQKEVCMAEILDCEKAIAMKNFTAICALPKDVGPCRGSFTRWYFDTTMQKCLQFTYGGCRGNNNRYNSQEECIDLCMDFGNKGQETSTPFTPDYLGDGGPQDCMVTPWSEWSSCSATCGRGYKYKRRMIKREPSNGGKACPKKLEKKKRCDVPKCPMDCELGPWSDWTPCGKTCGYDSIQERSRKVLHRAKRGGEPCGPRLMRRYCLLPPCPEDLKETVSGHSSHSGLDNV